jgi:serine/threonine-protein kinase
VTPAAGPPEFRDEPAGESRLERIFDAALDTPVRLRRAFVASECADDPALEARVLELLEANDAGTGLLDVPLTLIVGPLLDDGMEGDTAATPSAAQSGIPAGTRVGPYRVVRLLGKGGMGAVYLADRDDGAFEQQVALKVVNAGIVTHELEQRFLRERQILARLEHPRIARLLHGGLTADGHPYLAMQLVEGRPITAWADETGLGVRGRLDLFLQVCDAVHYAHGRLVVHRDLKPSNIVVTAAGEVCLLDFGIARLLTADDDTTLATRTGYLLLTPEYAAPELLLGESVTTATDVYALGVVLHELLTGRRPQDADVRSLVDLMRLAKTEPPPASRVPGLDTARRRQLEGDLDAIVAKALRREPDRRYPSVEALADDVRAHLERRPVAARPDSRVYRIGRFVRRNTMAVAASAIAVLALVAGLAVSLRMTAVAREEAARSAAVGDFLFSLWEGADPDLNRGRVPDARDFVERGLARVDSLGVAAGPSIRVDMLTTLGWLYRKLGDYDQAVAVFRRAVDEARSAFGTDERTGEALDGLAQSLIEAGDPTAAESVARESIRIRSAAGSADTALSGSYSTLGSALSNQSDFEGAREAHLAALDLDRRAAGPGSALVATDLNNLGVNALDRGDYEEAEARHREALAISRQSLGNDHASTAISLGNLAAVLRGIGSLEEAETLAREALAIRRTVLGPEHPDIAISLEQISLTVGARGRHIEADSLAVDALELRRRVLGERHPSTVTSLNNLAIARFRLGEYEWAAAAQEQVATLWRAELGLGDERAITAVHNLGVMRLRAGQLDEAETHLVDALEARRRLLGEEHPATATSLRWVAELRREQGRFRDGLTLSRQALAIFEQHYPAGHARITEAQIVIGSALVEDGLATEAVPVLRSAFEARQASLPADALPIAEARVWLGIALLRSGNGAAGRAFLDSALASYEAAGRAHEREAVRARSELAGPPATAPPSGQGTKDHHTQEAEDDQPADPDPNSRAHRAAGDQRMLG